ncbi:MAG: ATP-binding protein [Acidimicrobiales bacterium]
MSLRLRVALLTAVISTIIMAAGGVALLAAFRADQRAATRAVLDQQFDVLAEPAVTAVRSRRPRLGSVIENRLLAPAVVRVWVDDTPALSVGAEGVDLGPPSDRELTYVGDHAVLVGVVEPRLAPAAPTHTVQVAVSTADAESIATRLRRRVVRLVAMGAVLFAAGGWLAAAGALRPLSRLRGVTEEVATSADLSRRVSVPGSAATELDRLAASFNQMMRRLEEADEGRRRVLDSARSFGAAAAHELRTPLTSLGTNIEVLAAHPDHPERERVLEALVADHHRMAQLLDGLRVLARGDLAGPELFETLDLADVAEQAVLDARRHHPGDEVAFAAPDGPVTVTGWRDGLRIMVDNLVANALVHGRSADGVARVRVELDEWGDRVRLTVTDAGPGIPAAERTAVLERFVRGEGVTGSGSGLGLAMVDQQARLHGGSLTITDVDPDVEGGGACLVVELARPT